MTKRNAGKFKRNARDMYDTPEEAVLPLIPYVRYLSYYEPCVGGRALTRALHRNGVKDCVGVDDIVEGVDARTHFYGFNGLTYHADCFITNPPWARESLHPIIDNLSKQAPTWLLFDADWMHTKQAIPHMEYCTDIVSVGRVSWMGNGVSGFDNCCWYHFDQNQDGPPLFHPRTA